MKFRVNNPYTSRVLDAASVAEVLELVKPEFAQALNHRGYTDVVIKKDHRTYYQVRNSRGRTLTGCVIFPERV